jgi:hypothetical protein
LIKIEIVLLLDCFIVELLAKKIELEKEWLCFSDFSALLFISSLGSFLTFGLSISKSLPAGQAGFILQRQ